MHQATIHVSPYALQQRRNERHMVAKGNPHTPSTAKRSNKYKKEGELAPPANAYANKRSRTLS